MCCVHKEAEEKETKDMGPRAQTLDELSTSVSDIETKKTVSLEPTKWPLCSNCNTAQF